MSCCNGEQLPFDGKIRASDDGSYVAYMNPPYVSNHASFIEQLPDGTLTLAWFSGSEEGADGVSIVFSYLLSNSSQFSDAKVLSYRSGYSNQNPVLFYDDTTSVLHLFHSQQPANDGESDATIWHCQTDPLSNKFPLLTDTIASSSFDFSTPVELFSSKIYNTAIGYFPKNRIIPTSDNKGVIFPIYNTQGTNYAIIAINTNRNKLNDSNEWSFYQMKDSNDLVQPSIVVKPNDIKNGDYYLKAFLRDRNALAIHQCSSTDNGQEWETPQSYYLPNNNAAIHANIISYDTNEILANGDRIKSSSDCIGIIFNDYNGDNGNGRTPLSMALSFDDGASFTNIKTLQYHDDNQTHLIQGKSVEYSYPTFLQTKNDGWIHAVYTYNRQTIKYRKFNFSWVMGWV